MKNIIAMFLIGVAAIISPFITIPAYVIATMAQGPYLDLVGDYDEYLRLAEQAQIKNGTYFVYLIVSLVAFVVLANIGDALLNADDE